MDRSSRGVMANENRRNRLGSRVWLQANGKRRSAGMLYWTSETSVLIREDGEPDFVVLPKAAEGSRSGFLGDDKK